MRWFDVDCLFSIVTVCKSNQFSDCHRRARKPVLTGIAKLTSIHMAVFMALPWFDPGFGLAADARSIDPERLTELPIEQLMNIEVTTVSRSPQKVSQSAAAVAVITQEDIRRSGATTISEALRMAPGLDVARIDANKWAISSRGFNDFFANKLLVLIDGRSVYTPLFSGVFWDVQDTMMEDIERIEVIRGPGASLWGANAVNGIINVITKSAADTQGGLVTGGGGNEERGFGGIRYGGKLGGDAYYRVYAKYFNRDDFVERTGQEAFDEWDMIRGGFRTDWRISQTDALTVQGDYYEGTVGQRITGLPLPVPFTTLEGPVSVAGGNLLGSWKHTFSEASELGLQLYYDRTERFDRVHRETRDTYDLDFQHRFPLGTRQEFMWGLGYRYSQDDLAEGKDRSGNFAFVPPERGDQLVSAFLQDEVTLVEDLLRLTVGSKFEHNDYTGFEVQPSARALFTPHINHTFWAAVSRAVRTPSRFEHTIAGWIGPAYLAGNTDFEAEQLLAYELGYRWQATKQLSFDVAGFYNEYDGLRGAEVVGLRAAFPPPVPPFPVFRLINTVDGETYGVETSANWNATSSWRLNAGYSLLKMQLHRRGLDLAGDERAEGSSPQNQFQLRSYLDLPCHLQFDTALYYVDNLSTRGVPSYVRLDARLGWRPRHDLELSVGAQNILDDRHPEFGPSFLVEPTEVERSVYAKVTWRF